MFSICIAIVLDFYLPTPPLGDLPTISAPTANSSADTFDRWTQNIRTSEYWPATASVSMLPMQESRYRSAPGENISVYASYSRSLVYVGDRAIETKPGQNIHSTLLSFPKSDYTAVAYIDERGKTISPITKNTVIKTRHNLIESVMLYAGNSAFIDIGPFRGAVFKSPRPYHKKWFELYKAMGTADSNSIYDSGEALWKSFQQPQQSDPCTGLVVSLDAQSHFDLDDIYSLTVSRFGKPTKQLGRLNPGAQYDGHYWARWDKKDRLIDFEYTEDGPGIELRVIFKP